MSGIFTGAGVGPGDPELMTLKAVRAIEECSVIAIPVSDSTLVAPVYELAGSEDGRNAAYLERCVAYQIAAGASPETTEKDRIYLPMPMIKEKERLKAIHDRDPTVYSTCMYVHKRLKRAGYTTQIIPGIPSFCAAAARMDIPLVENRQELHVLPASYDLEESLNLPGTKVLMKAGRKMGEVKRLLAEKGMDAVMVENCGMKNEKIYSGAQEIPEQAGYYSLLVVKEKQTGGRER